jgi:hypothetical protein
VVVKPIDFFSKIPPNSGLHLVPIQYTKMFEDFYTLGEFTKDEYPNLLQGKDRIDTIAVPAVLAVFNWPKNSDRYRKVQRFVEYLFNRWDSFQRPPFHPKWKEVNLAATVPGWTRFSAAEEMLQRIATGPKPDPQIGGEVRCQSSRAGGAPNSEAERDVLFRDFLQWRGRQGAH